MALNVRMSKDFKAGVIALVKDHFRATERHLPYGITQCYLPPDAGDHAPL